MYEMAKDLDRLLSGLTDNDNESVCNNDQILAEFLELATDIDPDVGEQILNDHKELLERRTQLSMLYGKYLQTQEYSAFDNLLENVDQGNPFEFKKGGKFAEDAYSRVSDMFKVCDFSACGRFVMVGCGPLPVTILQVLDYTKVPVVIGIDTDSDAVATANDLFRLKSADATAICSDGQAFSYDGADIVYIANMCAPKVAVLNAVEKSIRQGLQVIVREPFSLGRLLSESVEDDISDAWNVVGRGVTDRRFLSRHLFLRPSAVDS